MKRKTRLNKKFIKQTHIGDQIVNPHI